MKSKVVRSLCVMVCLSAGAAAQVPVPGWVQLASSGPSGRYYHAMAYDSLRGRLVLFGGQSQATPYLGDTWEWDGSSWTQVATTGPLPRHSHAMVYDNHRHRVVLFGGHGGSYLGDTWEWDGTSWIPQFLLSGPVARFRHAMAYDSQRHRTVLFGGNNGLPVGDIWEWDGTSWVQQLVSGPPARYLHAMAFDIGRARTVLFGGYAVSGYLGDTWEWDGTSWTQFAGSAPSPRIDHAMAFDGSKVVLFGGAWLGGTFGDTWTWNGISWSSVSLASPPARYQHAMAYDELHGQTLLFGGYGGPGYLGDTWRWTSLDVANATAYGAGCGSPSLDFQPNLAARPIIGQVARATIVNPPTPVAAVMIGLSNQLFGGTLPLPVTLASLSMPGCDLWQSAEFFGFGTSPLPPSSLEFSLLIPNVPGALGFRCYLQSYAFAPGQNPLSIIVSNGIAWRFGAL